MNYRKKQKISYWHADKFAVFQPVEYLFGTGFYAASNIGLDPNNDIGDPVGSLEFERNWTDSMSSEDKVENKRMILAVPGEIVDVQKIIANWREVLPPHLASLFSYSST